MSWVVLARDGHYDDWTSCGRPGSWQEATEHAHDVINDAWGEGRQIDVAVVQVGFDNMVEPSPQARWCQRVRQLHTWDTDHGLSVGTAGGAVRNLKEEGLACGVLLAAADGWQPAPARWGWQREAIALFRDLVHRFDNGRL